MKKSSFGIFIKAADHKSAWSAYVYTIADPWENGRLPALTTNIQLADVSHSRPMLDTTPVYTATVYPR